MAVLSRPVTILGNKRRHQEAAIGILLVLAAALPLAVPIAIARSRNPEGTIMELHSATGNGETSPLLVRYNIGISLAQGP